ncbi:MAG: N-acetylneuraminate synthase family protein [Chthoniobacterales bacterium]|nr:N-acetylneuraminate synthase family protein [Chthoniobacterales bacterium]
MTINRDFFEELFVLEMANNHWGNLDRALKIVADFSKVVRFNNVRATIKFQLRDVDNFIHRDFRNRKDIRYIQKTLDTKMSREHFEIIVDAIEQSGCIPSATPFDEASVDFCEKLELPLIKIASSDINDWFLIEHIAKTRKPVIASSGGSSLKDTDDLVTFFANRKIPLALNHCVSLYPTEDDDLQINQIDFLKKRYPNNTIGFSTHEYHDWETSIAIAYAKGARTFERHIDIETESLPFSPYCSLPYQIDLWFKAFRRAKAMCGYPGTVKRTPLSEESKYLDTLVRGVYAKKDLKRGDELNEKDLYLAIPLQKGQISCREIMNGHTLLVDLKQDTPLMIDQIDTPYAYAPELKKSIYHRGI